MRTDACRARGQVRPQLEARMMPESSNSETKTMNMIEAINSAMDVMLARDPNTVVMGEDVGFFGGVFRATAGLQKKHRSEEHTSELQSLMRISYAVFCLKKKIRLIDKHHTTVHDTLA